MSRITIKNHRGEYASYSTVADDFVTPFMSRDEYEKWRDEEYGRSKTPLEYESTMSIDEAIFNLSIAKSDENIIKSLRAVGIIAEREEGNQGEI